MRKWPLAISLCLAASAAFAGPLAVEPSVEDVPAAWVAYPAAAEGRGDVVRRFVERLIAERIPELEPAGSRVLGGLAYRLREGFDASVGEHIARRLEAIPGLRGSSPLPSASEVLRKKMRVAAAGGPLSRAAGLIVRYRGEEGRGLAKSGKALAYADLEALSRTVGIALARSRAMSGESFVLDFAEETDILTAELAARRLELDPGIEFASPNGFAIPALVPNDTMFGSQWNLTSPTAGINVTGAWDITTGSSGIRIAVVDTGYLAHPDFNSRIRGGYDFVSDPARAGDGGGRDSDPTDAGDWAPAGACGAAARDSTWHGTHVIGTAAATGNNGAGIAGINWVSPIVPVRVLGRCGGTDADILDGLRWAAGLSVPNVPANANPARIINMSLGGPGNCILDRPAYQAAVWEAMQAGASVIVAAGNDSESALVNVPASCIGTVKVAAIGPNGDKASYSNYSRAIEIAAPGGSGGTGSANAILSTYATGRQSDPGNATYQTLNGTSMASPHVAGVASLALSANPSLTVAEVRDLLRVTARPFPSGSTCAAQNDCGLGIVDANAAVRLAQQVNQRINFSDLWWVPAEDGWGINLQQQGNIVFGTWFTYAPDGNSLWLVMPSMSRSGTQDFFIGDIYETTGVPIHQINGTRSLRTATKVGTALLAFFGVGYNLNTNLSFDSAIFYYEMGSVAGAKPIGRQIFRQFTVCNFVTGSRAAATNYQDLWWNPPEDGWGINFAHQGDTIFATWFTYNNSGLSTWLVGPSLTQTAPGRFTGRLYLTTGVPFNQINGAASIRSATDVGSLSLTFTNGETGRMDYTVAGTTGSKPIQRQVFSAPAGNCS